MTLSATKRKTKRPPAPNVKRDLIAIAQVLRRGTGPTPAQLARDTGIDHHILQSRLIALENRGVLLYQDGRNRLYIFRDSETLR